MTRLLSLFITILMIGCTGQIEHVHVEQPHPCHSSIYNTKHVHSPSYGNQIHDLINDHLQINWTLLKSEQIEHGEYILTFGCRMEGYV